MINTLGAILSELDKISDIDLRTGCLKFFKTYSDKFTTWPASIAFHHTGKGGLMEHTHEVIDLSLKIAGVLDTPVDHNHLIAAAFLHDFGKINDYKPDPEFKRDFVYVIPKGSEHSLFPVIFYPSITGKALPLEVSHAILSHMGGWSVTSVFPYSILDAVLHSADLISSRMG